MPWMDIEKDNCGQHLLFLVDAPSRAKMRRGRLVSTGLGAARMPVGGPRRETGRNGIPEWVVSRGLRVI